MLHIVGCQVTGKYPLGRSWTDKAMLRFFARHTSSRWCLRNCISTPVRSFVVGSNRWKEILSCKELKTLLV